MIVERVSSIGRFRTPEFLASRWVRARCERVPYRWVTRQEMPPGHFGTYFGATQMRTYANPYVGDLYELHELTHSETLTYDAKRSWLEWSRGIIASELEASLVSECFAYLHIPDLRAKTFAHEIWVDRFLDRLTPSADPIELQDEIRAERLRAMNAPAYNDFLEAQISNYYRQNFEWCRIWAEDARTRGAECTPAFRVVEAHMASPDRDATHQEWIDAHTQIGEWTAPFLTQGKAFAEVYKASNAKFGNRLLSR